MVSPTEKCALHPKEPATWYPHKVKGPAQLGQWLCKECEDKVNKGKIDLIKLQKEGKLK